MRQRPNVIVAFDHVFRELVLFPHDEAYLLYQDYPKLKDFMVKTLLPEMLRCYFSMPPGHGIDDFLWDSIVSEPELNDVLGDPDAVMLVSKIIEIMMVEVENTIQEEFLRVGVQDLQYVYQRLISADPRRVTALFVPYQET